ncbi:hypothetical protein K8R03_00875 [Candidatus Kaiserbacteria bacterium]|nr:hypothetical protein [Candidatus Kaiserbacteria bacterium]
MSISLRLPLTDAPVSRTQVPDIEGSFYTWHPRKRRFLVEHNGDIVEHLRVNRRAVAMRLLYERGDCKPVLSPLVPPQDPVQRILWDSGFLKRFRVATVEIARRKVIELKREDGLNIVSVVGQHFAFAFEPPSVPSADLRPHVWAIAPCVSAQQIAPILRRHCSR